MSTLKELQESFQRAVVEGDDAILAEIVDTSREKRDILLGVYRNAYVLRLIEFLTNDHKKLHALLGDDQFADMARAYVDATPSHTPNARWYAARLPEFLRTAKPYRGQPALTELAALERALNDAFDAPEAETLTMEDFAGIAPDAWPSLTFAPHPAVRRLDFKTNAADIWQALDADETPPAPCTPGEICQLIVYRSDATAKYRKMTSDEAMMWDEAAKGVAFSVLCELLATFGGEDIAPARAAGYLKGWIDGGALAQHAPSA